MAIGQTLDEAYKLSLAIYRQNRAYWVNAKALVTQSQVAADVLFNIAQNPSIVVPQIQALAQLPGLITYAQSAGARNDPTYDPVAEFQAWRTALFAIRDQVINTFPKDPSGFLLFYQFNPDGTTVIRSFASTLPAVVTLSGLIDQALATGALSP